MSIKYKCLYLTKKKADIYFYVYTNYSFVLMISMYVLRLFNQIFGRSKEISENILNRFSNIICIILNIYTNAVLILNNYYSL